MVIHNNASLPTLKYILHSKFTRGPTAYCKRYLSHVPFPITLFLNSQYQVGNNNCFILFQDSTGVLVVNEFAIGCGAKIRGLCHGFFRGDSLRGSWRILGIYTTFSTHSQIGWSHIVFHTRMVFLASSLFR